MVEFINRISGNKMLVAEERVEEYLAAGHKLAAKSSKPAEVVEVKEEKPAEVVEKPKRPARKKK